MERKVIIGNKKNTRLAGIYHVPKKPVNKAGLIICHGYNHHKDMRLIRNIARAAEKTGIYALRFDFSGQGESSGRFTDITYTRYLKELDSAIDFMKKQGIKRIALTGHSLGGAVAALTAVRNFSVNLLIGLAPVSEIYKTHLRKWRRQYKKTGKNYLLVRDARNPDLVHRVGRALINDARRYNLLKEAGRIYQPARLIVGTNDVSVYPAEIKKLFDRIACDAKDLVSIKGGDHLFTGSEDRIARLVVAWCRKYLINKESKIVISIIKNRNHVLILKRSRRVSYYPGYWHVVGGYINDKKPIVQAYNEIVEETGIKKNQLKLLAKGRTYKYTDSQTDPHTWVIHPFLFESRTRDVKLDWEHTQYRWIEPKDFVKYKKIPLMGRTLAGLLSRRLHKILLINTSEYNQVLLALYLNGKIVKFSQVISASERDSLLNIIDKFIYKKIRLNELSGLVVINGPGPFTAVRVGVTVAKTLGLAGNIPVYSFRKSKAAKPEKIFAKIIQNKISPSRNIVPIYDREPNITKPKK